MRTRSVRQFSRALYQVSVCLITSARYSQVRSPNTRTSQHIVAVSVRVVHIAPVSRGLHGQMRRVGTTCKPQRRSSLSIMQQICHNRRFQLHRLRLTGRIPNAFRKDFFSFEMSRSNKTTTKKIRPNEPGVARTFFSFYVIIITSTLRFRLRYVTVAGATFSFTLRYRSGREAHRGSRLRTLAVTFKFQCRIRLTSMEGLQRAENPTRSALGKVSSERR